MDKEFDEKILGDESQETEPAAEGFNKFFRATDEEREKFESVLVGNPRGDFLMVYNALLDIFRGIVK